MAHLSALGKGEEGICSQQEEALVMNKHSDLLLAKPSGTAGAKGALLTLSTQISFQAPRKESGDGRE